jgi:hypothetical protein
MAYANKHFPTTTLALWHAITLFPLAINKIQSLSGQCFVIPTKGWYWSTPIQSLWYCLYCQPRPLYSSIFNLVITILLTTPFILRVTNLNYLYPHFVDIWSTILRQQVLLGNLIKIRKIFLRMHFCISVRMLLFQLCVFFKQFVHTYFS